jgi:FkbM family methyltransferase
VKKTLFSVLVLAVALVAFGWIRIVDSFPQARKAYRIPIAAMALVTKNPNCGISEAIGGFVKNLSWRTEMKRVRAQCKLIATDPAGLEKWQTPLGEYWIPAGNIDAFAHTLSERNRHTYENGPDRVRPGDVVIDCGAYVGDYTREALQAGASTVVAIEPSPENLACLRRNVQNDSRAIIVSKGVWNKDGQLALNVSATSTICNGVREVDAARATKEVLVPVTRLDSIVAELGLKRVDVIKMDIEGAEPEAVAGAPETLKKFNPLVIIATEHASDEPERCIEQLRKVWQSLRWRCNICGEQEGKIVPTVMSFRQGTR